LSARVGQLGLAARARFPAGFSRLAMAKAPGRAADLTPCWAFSIRPLLQSRRSPWASTLIILETAWGPLTPSAAG
jgi:hypothetical protein